MKTIDLIGYDKICVYIYLITKSCYIHMIIKRNTIQLTSYGMVELAQHVVDGDPGIDTFLFARNYLSVCLNKHELELHGDVYPQVSHNSRLGTDEKGEKIRLIRALC